MTLKSILFFGALLLFSAQGQAAQWLSPLDQDHPLVGRLYDVKNKREISTDLFFERLHKASAILIGEKHDNPDHHHIETEILSHLLKDAPDLTVVLEVLDASQTQALTGLLPKDSDSQLQTKLNWPDKTWPWGDYGPLIKQAVTHDALLVAGNLSRTQMKTVYSAGSEALEQDSSLSTALAVSQTVRERLLEDVYQQHCKLIPKNKLQPMVNIQLARDARMAHRLAEHAIKAPTILIAGSFHVRKDTAVPLHLKYINAELKPVVLILHEVNTDSLKFEGYLSQQAPIADYIWFTPRYSDRDYCQDIKRTKY
ncbi:MAG: ChaN family lipoprotein [Pontibacterium sp.]